jgi:hypothetical protein
MSFLDEKTAIIYGFIYVPGEGLHGIADNGLCGLIVGHVLHLPVQHEDASILPDHDVALSDADIVTGLEIGVCVRVADLRFPVDGKVQRPQMDGFIPFHILGVPVPDQLEIVIGMGDFRIQPVLEILLLIRGNIELHRCSPHSSV